MRCTEVPESRDWLHFRQFIGFAGIYPYTAVIFAEAILSARKS